MGFFYLFNDQIFQIIFWVITFILVVFSLFLNKKYEFGFGAICLSFICFSVIFLIISDYVNYFSNMKNVMKTQDDWGTMGDYLGGTLNPILTFITIIILLWTTHFQNKELKKQLQRQDQDSKKNNFDKMFTLMLEQHNEYIDKQEFILASNKIYKDLFELIDSYNYKSEQLNEIFSRYHEINTYLRLLYRILKYLTEENQTSGNYSRLLRSFCSEKLLFIIAVNSLRIAHNKDFSNYKTLLENNNFLEHMDLQCLYKKWSNYLTKITSYLKRIEIEKQSDGNFSITEHHDRINKFITTDIPKNKVAQTIRNNAVIKQPNNLFMDILKIDQSAFSNIDDYQNCKKDIMELENSVEITLQQKIEEIDKL